MCLRDTIGAVVEMVAADASKKGLNIAYTVDEVLLKRAVLGDAIRIRQVHIRLDACALAPPISYRAFPGRLSTPDGGWHHGFVQHMQLLGVCSGHAFPTLP